MQLLLSSESQAKCGWATHRGIYQFVYLPFGLRNAGAYFRRAMSRILAGLEGICLAYLDDIIVFDNDFDSHLRSLRKVLERFRVFNIKASGKKLTGIAQSKITFLGHEISGNSYASADRNISVSQNLPTPKRSEAFLAWLTPLASSYEASPSSWPHCTSCAKKTLPFNGDLPKTRLSPL
ncbi:hypothetical protein Y032_0356g3360 [Ancylostoma ceylanicum]|uniref:Reverse transcriptase domain-containing protein n=1 Tax=Ancylostoma ceylanicum TaxID=53326 RepID=A0A016RXA5_9BILA|nr:hypothetical protein Y032_0356g3360 [Ancylostoma ceylanicum]